jgi:hypothetical protein
MNKHLLTVAAVVLLVTGNSFADQKSAEDKALNISESEHRALLGVATILETHGAVFGKEVVQGVSGFAKPNSPFRTWHTVRVNQIQSLEALLKKEGQKTRAAPTILKASASIQGSRRAMAALATPAPSAKVRELTATLENVRKGANFPRRVRWVNRSIPLVRAALAANVVARLWVISNPNPVPHGVVANAFPAVYQGRQIFRSVKDASSAQATELTRDLMSLFPSVGAAH